MEKSDLTETEKVRQVTSRRLSTKHSSWQTKQSAYDCDILFPLLEDVWRLCPQTLVTKELPVAS
jgi:hypothetical protein